MGKNYRRRCCLISSGTDICPLLSGNLICTNSARSTNSPNKNTTCSSEMTASGEAICTFWLTQKGDDENKEEYEEGEEGGEICG